MKKCAKRCLGISILLNFTAALLPIVAFGLEDYGCYLFSHGLGSSCGPAIPGQPSDWCPGDYPSFWTCQEDSLLYKPGCMYEEQNTCDLGGIPCGDSDPTKVKRCNYMAYGPQPECGPPNDRHPCEFCAEMPIVCNDAFKTSGTVNCGGSYGCTGY